MRMEDGGPAGGILSYFARHRTVANLLMVADARCSASAAIPNMRAQFFPDVISDEVSVSVRWDGAGAEDVDAAIVQVLEPALLAVEGVAATRSAVARRVGRASSSSSSRAGTWAAPPMTCRRRWTR